MTSSGSARASRAANDATSLAFLFDARARRTAAGTAALPISNLRWLLLRQAMQRAGAEHQVNGMNADHWPVFE